ncbi:MAG: hypothetical protein A2Y62_08690 [Candidatus Fischerbacteria bacterium RBG_13_37_8]|uniref:Flagellar motor switch protein FliN-like C-terminal domain-containing protein n=1 Tax=Candidatus Fischerbacteria bacterium RBG_13_37_8 TaxID=1817863 RepID=A0A1F5VQX4_9BACT|nr:MAG: hypothetical protein A2Y62_08690 [Candidatus Fischerbacteria bacterium RBG_13_37_8]
MDNENNANTDSSMSLSQANGDNKRIAESIEITVAVELCRLKMTLVEAMDLQVGRIVSLNRDLSPEVMLSVNNKIIGKGKLVQIEGRMGVQVFGMTKETE